MTEKIDTQFYKMALKAVGFNVSDVDTELIINIIKIVEEKNGNVGLKDIFEKRFEVYGLHGLEVDNNGNITKK